MADLALLASGPLTQGQVPLGEAIAFWILAPISVAGAIGMVLLRNACTRRCRSWRRCSAWARST
jgi:NADH-quinone oxidoreductase subunit J